MRPSVRRSVRPVRPSVCPAVRPSVRLSADFCLFVISQVNNIDRFVAAFLNRVFIVVVIVVIVVVVVVVDIR